MRPPRTVADLVVPPDAQRIERRPWTEVQRDLFATVRAFVANPRATQRQKLSLLAQVVLPLAQCQLMLGCSPAVAVEHSAELLEANFLQSALTETPSLATWFGL